MSPEDPSIPARATVDAIYRAESRRVLATLIRLLGDFDLAEEALHDAFTAAVERWPAEGVPANPRAWLVSAGRFKAIDQLRRRAPVDAPPTTPAGSLRGRVTAPPTLAQRIVRAKGKIRDAGIPYQVPGRTDLPERLDTVLQVVYLVFNEGYSASAGAAVTRPHLSAEAIRLGRLLVELLPDP